MLEDVKVGDILVFFGGGHGLSPIVYCKVVGITKTLIKTDNWGNFRIKDGYAPGEYSAWTSRARVEKVSDANIERVKAYRNTKDCIRLMRQIKEVDFSSFTKEQLESIVAIIKEGIESQEKESNVQSN